MKDYSLIFLKQGNISMLVPSFVSANIDDSFVSVYYVTLWIHLAATQGVHIINNEQIINDVCFQNGKNEIGFW